MPILWKMEHLCRGGTSEGEHWKGKLATRRGKIPTGSRSEEASGYQRRAISSVDHAGPGVGQGAWRWNCSWIVDPDWRRTGYWQIHLDAPDCFDVENHQGAVRIR